MILVALTECNYPKGKLKCLDQAQSMFVSFKHCSQLENKEERFTDMIMQGRAGVCVHFNVRETPTPYPVEKLFCDVQLKQRRRMTVKSNILT